MPLCFAYGSNMDRHAMAVRCPASRALGPARLPHHRPVIMREGYMSVVPDPRRHVHGLVWDLALADMPALDRYEGLREGLYAKVQRRVLTAAGPRGALVYLGRNAGPGCPPPGYLEAVLAAARREELPSSYIGELQRLSRAPGSKQAHAMPRGEETERRRVRPTRSSPIEPQARIAPWRWEP